jgi:hypothetical protein
MTPEAVSIADVGMGGLASVGALTAFSVLRI